MVRVLGKSNTPVYLNQDTIRCDINIIDSDKARRATQALQVQPSFMLSNEDFQKASPPRCQSETDMSCDSDGDSLCSYSGGQVKSPMDERQAEVVQRRKERRRERNKLSAQAYRLRKREETQNQDKVVSDLEEHQKRLNEKVAILEHEKDCVEKFLRNCFTVPFPVPRNINNNNHTHVENNNNTMTTWNTSQQQCDQDNGNVAFGTCATVSQGQTLITVNNEMIVS